MERLREWGFPVALLVGWMLAASYTVSLMFGPMDQTRPQPPEPPGAEATIVALSAY